MVSLLSLQNVKPVILKKQNDSVYFKMEVNYFSSNKSKRAVDMKKVKKNRVKLLMLILPAVKGECVPLPIKLKADLRKLSEVRYGKDWENLCIPLKFLFRCNEHFQPCRSSRRR